MSLRGVRRVFEGGVAAVEGVDLDVEPGAFVSLLGPSGCGKSTLLRLIAGLDRADAGQISLAPSADLAAEEPRGRPRVAYVFQDPHLLPWRSVLDNAALPLELAGVSRAERLAAARDALVRVELSDAAERLPAELSGGMRMRASLARALVTRPALLLLDEPFAALDELTRYRLDEMLRSLWAALPMTVLFVTHSITEAAYLSERAIVLSPRPARIVADQTIALPDVRSPALRTTPEFSHASRALFEALERGGA